MKIGAIIAAILLPPLGVWLSEGLTRNFWIATGLTLIAFVPGVVFALVTVTNPGLLGGRRTVAAD